MADTDNTAETETETETETSGTGIPHLDRQFETLFDGDEIDGKRYKLGETVTGLDAGTAEYLVRAGRIAEKAPDEDAEKPARRAAKRTAS